MAVLVWFNQRFWHTGLELGLAAIIGTPHRWVTLGLLSNDRQRQASQRTTLILVGAGTVLFYAALWRWTRDVAVLILVGYLWNFWHVAAQHTGVARIYSIHAQPEKRFGGRLEKDLLRIFMLYAFLRVGTLGAAYLDGAMPLPGAGSFASAAVRVDLFFLLIPAFLLVREARAFDQRLYGRYVYLTSVCLNYAAMIVLCHFRFDAAALAVAVANAVFHATEYFSIVTWSVHRRARKPESWFLPALARNWGLTLGLFLVWIGASSLMLAAHHALAWMLVNTLVAYLHYAYDGVIWKMPAVFRPAGAS